MRLLVRNGKVNVGPIHSRRPMCRFGGSRIETLKELTINFWDRMAIVWNASLYTTMAEIYIELLETRTTVFNTHIYEKLGERFDEVFSKSSVMHHVSRLKKMAEALLALGMDAPAHLRADAVSKIASSALTFNDTQCEKLIALGALLVEKKERPADADSSKKKKKKTKKMELDVSAAILSREYKRVDPKVLRSVTRVINAELTDPLSGAIKKQIQEGLVAAITPRIVSKVVAQVSERVCGIFATELEKYYQNEPGLTAKTVPKVERAPVAPKVKRVAKKARLEPPPVHEEEEEEEEGEEGEGEIDMFYSDEDEDEDGMDDEDIEDDDEEMPE